MKYYKLNTGALMGLTTLKIEDVSAYTVETVKGGLIRADIYKMEIHMNSGTIFTTTMEASEKMLWEQLFFPRRVLNDEEE
tara:strand:- start:3781 stop:4020 length:240 start_codon:yes stop_codon:yes gene_type:complete